MTDYRKLATKDIILKYTSLGFYSAYLQTTRVYSKRDLLKIPLEKKNVDGSDLAAHLSHIFQVLNTPQKERYSTLDETLASLPYVNGKLFEEQFANCRI
jgi:hypothetical protein